ncbi:xanthine dehydrogenase family protein molybdopterin-binding subunit [Runella rosea]|uniref:Xanthine dehydrogenase family protein molybdopterin-binding subunit n=1 Tax=Runella rosea TaxID=2259595 RepID=A0A344TLB0_9BACT|nr:molybdopterin cofactor-binding domain-containing protein [Runella rosea]AXE19431.1 xanthine dehydrogenase family protein molybdopterin-binding subunit [Runella rosea]
MSNRRDFIKTLGLSSAGLMMGLSASSKPTVIPLNGAGPSALALEINPFIVIEPNGKIILINPRPDMGQGSTQAVPSLLAEELEVRLDQVTIWQSDGKGKYGDQTSGGSSSVRALWKPIRQAGAAAREMLVKAAAQRWSVPESECYAKEAKVFHKPSGKSLTYGEVADEASKFEVPKNPALKEAKDFKIVGKYAPRLDVPARVTGKAVFGIDVDVPGMVYAVMIHNPHIFGKVVSIDDTEALKIKGVQKVLKCERPMPHRTAEAVAIIADNYWAALSAKKVVKVHWDNGTIPHTLTTDAYYKKCAEAAIKEGLKGEESGDFAAAFAGAAKKVEALYETPFLAHAPMEPENAIAHVKEDGTVEVWAPIQGPDWALRDLAGYLKIKPEQIKINVALLGGAFGRKAYHDFLLEACFLSKEVKKPVKLVWTREDDITQGPYRPGMMARMQGGVDEKGNIVAYHHHPIGESIQFQVFKAPNDKPDDWICGELSQKEQKYAIPAFKVSFTHVDTEIPIVWWRSVYASNFGFSQEGFLDELIHSAGKDPLKARLEMMTDERFKKVLETLGEKAKWGEKLPAGHGKGIAVFKSFGSISACCITVAKHGAGVKVEKVVSVIDCGHYVNPDNVKAQTEGNIVMGITAAVKKGVTFTHGQADHTNFHQYHVMRFNEMPAVEIHIVESGAEPGGVGEPGLPPIAPALANAVFAATGKRIRKLPFDLNTLA